MEQSEPLLLFFDHCWDEGLSPRWAVGSVKAGTGAVSQTRLPSTRLPSATPTPRPLPASSPPATCLLLQWYPLVKAVAIKGPWKEKNLTPRFLGAAEKAQGLLLSLTGAPGEAQTFSSPARISPTKRFSRVGPGNLH